MSADRSSSADAVSITKPSFSVDAGTMGGTAVGFAVVTRAREADAAELNPELIVCALGRTEPSRDEKEDMESPLGCRDDVGDGI